jgi:hypothetical protein
MSDGRGILPEWRYWPAVPLATLFIVAMIGPLLSRPPQQEQSITGTYQHPEEKSEKIDPNERLADYTIWLTVFSGALAVLGGLELYWIVRQESWMRKSVEAAREQSNAATESNSFTRAAFAAENRPWITIENIEINGPFEIDETTKRPRLNIALTFRNIGRAPTAIFLWGVMRLVLSGGLDTGAALQTVLLEAGKFPTTGPTLLPNDQIRRHNLFVLMDQSDFARVSINNRLTVTVVGCIQYRPAMGRGTLYQTGFRFNVAYTGDSFSTLRQDKMPIMPEHLSIGTFAESGAWNQYAS